MDETFDFVVVGSGGGGLCAALLMRSLGKSVVVLEKTDFVGGTTARSGGVMWIPNNRYMREAGLAESPEAANAYLDAVVGNSPDTPGASPERRHAYVDQAPRMLEFLISQGLTFRRMPHWPDYYTDAPGASEPGRAVVAELFDVNRLGAWKKKLRAGFLPLPMRLDEAMLVGKMKYNKAGKKMLLRVLLRAVGNKLRGKHQVTAGNALQGQTLDAALRAGADIRLESPVSEILVEDGRVSGVVTVKDGKPWRIAARSGVLINAGGFAQNQAMLDAYIPGTLTEWSNVPEGDTGEMIEEGKRIGAALAQMDVRLGFQMAFPPELKPGALKAGVQNDLAKPHCILVDQTGERYMRESVSYMDFAEAMAERNKTVPALPSWMVVDSQYISRYMFAGSMAGDKKPKSWLESGFLKKADTLAELATACGMDPAKFTASVERFNGFARAGRDDDFHRGERGHERWLGDSDLVGAETLGTVEQGPFYAIQVYPGDVGTLGGLVTDKDARVLREDGTPIPGLYASGTSAASVFGRTSPGAGSSVGPSFTWGYVAAKHAANADNMAI